VCIRFSHHFKIPEIRRVHLVCTNYLNIFKIKSIRVIKFFCSLLSCLLRMPVVSGSIWKFLAASLRILPHALQRARPCFRCVNEVTPMRRVRSCQWDEPFVARERGAARPMSRLLFQRSLLSPDYRWENRARRSLRVFLPSNLPTFTVQRCDRLQSREHD